MVEIEVNNCVYKIKNIKDKAEILETEKMKLAELNKTINSLIIARENVPYKWEMYDSEKIKNSKKMDDIMFDIKELCEEWLKLHKLIDAVENCQV